MHLQKVSTKVSVRRLQRLVFHFYFVNVKPCRFAQQVAYMTYNLEVEGLILDCGKLSSYDFFPALAFDEYEKKQSVAFERKVLLVLL